MQAVSVVPTPMRGKSTTLYLGVALIVFSFILAFAGASSSQDSGGSLCLFSIICLLPIGVLLFAAGHGSGKQVRVVGYAPPTQPQIIIQQPIQTAPQTAYSVQHPASQSTQPTQPATQSTQPTPPVTQSAQPADQSLSTFSQQEEVGHWLTTARELELARDFEAAAEAYQKAGEFTEAGRIRKEFLEKQDKGVEVHIGRIGDNNLRDSVMMNDDEN